MGRVRRLLAAAGQRIDAQSAERARAALVADALTLDAASIQTELVRFLASEESIVDLSGFPEQRTTISEGLAKLGPGPAPEAITEVFARGLEGVESIDGEPVPDLLEDLAMSVETPIAELWRRAKSDGRTKAALVAADRAVPAGSALFARISDELQTLDAPKIGRAHV